MGVLGLWDNRRPSPSVTCRTWPLGEILLAAVTWINKSSIGILMCKEIMNESYMSWRHPLANFNENNKQFLSWKEDTIRKCGNCNYLPIEIERKTSKFTLQTVVVSLAYNWKKSKQKKETSKEKKRSSEFGGSCNIFGFFPDVCEKRRTG